MSVSCMFTRGPIDVVQLAPIRPVDKTLVLLTYPEYIGDLASELGPLGFTFRSRANYGVSVSRSYSMECVFTSSRIYDWTVTVIDLMTDNRVMVIRQKGSDGPCTTVEPVWPTIANAISENWGSGAEGFAGGTTPPRGTTPPVRSVPDANENVRPSDPVSGTGTAFIVDPAGVLLTAHHVVDQATSITVSCNGRAPVAVTVTSSSPTVDLALLTAVADLGTDTYLELSPSQPGLGDDVFTIGYPTPALLGPDPKYTNGTVSALSGVEGDASFLQISVPVQPGNSGGPLVNEQGEVIGVVVATADAPAFIRATDSIPQNINWAVKSVFASALFTLPAGGAASTVDPDDVIAHVTEATCLVEATGAAR